VSSTAYQVRFAGPTLIEKGRDTVITCPVYLSGALVAPSVVVVSIWTAASAPVVAAASGSVVGSVATYTVPAASTSGLPYGADWRIEWTLTLSSVVEVIQTDAALVRNAIRNPITDVDLYAREPALDPNGSAPIHSLSNFQTVLDDAWKTLLNRLLTDGQYPWKMPSAAVLRETMLALTLHRVYQSFTTGLNDAYGKTADAYRRDYHEAYRSIRYSEVIDPDQPSVTSQKVAAMPVFFLGQPKRRAF
jgi:hypothetical protein